MTKEQRDFIEWSPAYLALYDAIKTKGHNVEIDEKHNSLIVKFTHFYIDLSLSFNEHKIYITNAVNRNVTAERWKTDPHSFRYFSNSNVIEYLEKIESLESFIKSTEG